MSVHRQREQSDGGGVIAKSTNRSTAGTTTATAGRSRPPRKRQQEILEAAATVFHEHGYESTSIQDIAEAVGILKGSLYYYIDSKEDLLYAILQGVHVEALKNMDIVDRLDGDALQKIRAFVQIHLLFNAENLVKMGVFFQDFRSLSPERRTEIVEERDRYEKFLRKLVREGQREKVICPDINPKLATLAILGMTNWIYHWYRPGGEASARKVADEYADLIVSGLACSPETHIPGHRSQVARLPTLTD